MNASDPGKQPGVLRKVLWSGLYAGIAGLTTMASQKVAAVAWRLATGDHPPDTGK